MDTAAVTLGLAVSVRVCLQWMGILVRACVCVNCVCACVHACVRACVRACARACGHVGVRAGGRAGSEPSPYVAFCYLQ